MADAEQRCPSCGIPRVAGGRFCSGCARDLDAPEPTRVDSYVERYKGTAYDSSAMLGAQAPPAAGPDRVLLLLIGLVVVAVAGGAFVVASGVLKTGGQVASASIVPYVPSPSADPTVAPGGVCATEGAGGAAWPIEWKITFCDALDRFYVARKSVQTLMRAAEAGQADVAVSTAAAAGQQLDDADRVLGRTPSWGGGRGMLEDLRTVISGYREAIYALRFSGYTRSTAAIADAKRQIYTADKTLLRLRTSLAEWTTRDRPYARYLAFRDHVTPALKESQSMWDDLAVSHDLLKMAEANRLALNLGEWVRAQEEWLVANPEHSCYDKVAEEYKEYMDWAMVAAILARWDMNIGISDDAFARLLVARDEMERRQAAILNGLRQTPGCPGASADPASANPSSTP